MSISPGSAKIGVLLPTFGAAATPDRLRRLGALVEDLGFDSVWVRDQLAAPPLRFEHRDRTFVDPFVALAAVAATTRRIALGTAVLIPVRHPLVVAQLLSGIAHLAGPGRLIVGVGAGFQRATFDALGLDFDRRVELTRDLVCGLRALWSGDDVSFDGVFATFRGVTIDPRPTPPPPLWYGGSSGASVRFTMAHCDGWLPGRVPYAVFDRLVGPILDAPRPISLATIPCVVVDRDRASALEGIDVPALLADAAQRPAWRPVADFRSIDDMDGAVLAGSLDACVDGLVRWLARGLEHLVIDLRFMPDRLEETLRLLSREALPALWARSRPAAPGSAA